MPITIGAKRESDFTDPIGMLGDSTLAEYIKRPMKIRTRYKGKLVYAQVRRDGRIRFSQTLFDSPSLAGAAACARRTCNGWRFWEYERAPGDWVQLDELRK
jgi:Restriction Enzyme Adenine Methylase Associated